MLLWLCDCVQQVPATRTGSLICCWSPFASKSLLWVEWSGKHVCVCVVVVVIICEYEWLSDYIVSLDKSGDCVVPMRHVVIAWFVFCRGGGRGGGKQLVFLNIIDPVLNMLKVWTIGIENVVSQGRVVFGDKLYEPDRNLWSFKGGV